LDQSIFHQVQISPFALEVVKNLKTFTFNRSIIESHYLNVKITLIWKKTEKVEEDNTTHIEHTHWNMTTSLIEANQLYRLKVKKPATDQLL